MPTDTKPRASTGSEAHRAHHAERAARPPRPPEGWLIVDRGQGRVLIPEPIPDVARALLDADTIAAADAYAAAVDGHRAAQAEARRCRELLAPASSGGHLGVDMDAALDVARAGGTVDDVPPSQVGPLSARQHAGERLAAAYLVVARAALHETWRGVQAARPGLVASTRAAVAEIDGRTKSDRLVRLVTQLVWALHANQAPGLPASHPALVAITGRTRPDPRSLDVDEALDALVREASDALADEDESKLYASPFPGDELVEP